MTIWQRWNQTVKALKRDILALYWVTQDSRTPRWIKGLVILIVAYAFSPIDLIPDMIPLLGQLDDLILLPLGIALVIYLLPSDILADCRARAEAELSENRPVSRGAGIVIVGIWIVASILLISFFINR